MATFPANPVTQAFSSLADLWPTQPEPQGCFLSGAQKQMQGLRYPVFPTPIQWGSFSERWSTVTHTLETEGQKEDPGLSRVHCSLSH